MNNRNSSIILITLTMIVALLANSAMAAVMTGVITDSKTGEALPGATIMIKGTYFGASTNIDGYYKVVNIKSGTYTIEVSLISYKMIQKTAVHFEESDSINMDFKLEPSVLTLGKDIVVIGEKPMLDIGATESRSAIGSDQIKNLVVENATDLLKNQSGVVVAGDEIHIRGGRAYENAYLIDGISIQDPYSGGTAGLNITAGAIEEFEVLTGGFNAEYGQAMSGVVQVKTKEGSVQKYSGRLSYKTDNFGLFKKSTIDHQGKISSSNFNSDIGEAQLSGPVPFVKNMSFFSSGYASLSDTYLPHTHDLYSSLFGGSKYAPREANEYSGLFKITHRFSSTLKLVGSFSGSLNIDQGFQSNDFENPNLDAGSYPYQFQNILANYNTRTRVSNNQTLSLTHTTSPKFFYELKLSRFFTQQRSSVKDKSWFDSHEQPIDILPINYIPVYVTYFDSISHQPVRYLDHYDITTGDGFYDYGVGDQWRDYYFEQYTLKWDGNLSFGTRHLIKGGFESNFQEIQMVDINNPGIGKGGLGLDHDIYKVYPNTGSMYLQDKVSSFGLIVNAGLRLDWWFPGDYIDDLIKNQSSEVISPGLRAAYYNDTYSIFGHRGKAHISPRIGISHPVTENAMLFYSYGHFSKLPQPQRVYAKLSSTSTSSSYPLFGNPNLNPETTVSYELGLRYEVTTNDVLSVTTYYKDIFDYIAAFSITQGGRYSNQNFIMYFNLDYARSRGIEIEYKKRASKLLNMTLQGSYSIATGKSSSPKDELLVARGELEEKSIKENYLSWDRPLRVSADFSFYSGKGEHYNIWKLKLPDLWNAYLRLFWQSGQRYTTYTRIERLGQEPEYIKNDNNPYSKTAKSWRWMDLSVKKHFRLSKFQYSIFLEVTNLTNSKNSSIINPLTGQAYEYGDPVLTSWNDPMNPDRNPTYPFPFDPSRYLAPRNIKLGVSLSW
jgi:outer membrane receptor protein involved in Fe transport